MTIDPLQVYITGTVTTLLNTSPDTGVSLNEARDCLEITPRFIDLQTVDRYFWFSKKNKITVTVKTMAGQELCVWDDCSFGAIVGDLYRGGYTYAIMSKELRDSIPCKIPV